MAKKLGYKKSKASKHGFKKCGHEDCHGNKCRGGSNSKFKHPGFSFLKNAEAEGQLLKVYIHSKREDSGLDVTVEVATKKGEIRIVSFEGIPEIPKSAQKRIVPVYNSQEKTINGRHSILKDNDMTLAGDGQGIIKVKLDNLHKMNKDASDHHPHQFFRNKAIDEVKGGIRKRDDADSRHLRDQMEEYINKGDKRGADSIWFQIIPPLYNHKQDIGKILYAIKDAPELDKERDIQYSLKAYLEKFKPEGNV
ncbi:MAG: hypothetical protein KF802_02745 [Bdellovibrionaceae bacterium]|nr:hypothetical protein [Pseudobdellovibrionaceae bacterium]